MSLRKVAGLLAAFGLTVGLIGGGVGAVFTDQVTATQNISVGTFGCEISSTTVGASLGGYVNGHAHSVSYSAAATSSTGSAPFDFAVTSFGTIPVQVSLVQPSLSAPWSNLLADPGPQFLGTAGDSYTYHAGVAWAGLDNTYLGTSKVVTWTVNCGEAPYGAANYATTQCGTTTPIINVTEAVLNDEDSGVGGNYWAMDNYSRQIVIRQTAPGAFCATVSYTGGFVTLAGASPNNTGTVSAGVQGNYSGGYYATFTGTLLSSPLWATSGSVGAVDYACNGSGTCTGYINYLDQYFTSTASFAQPWWGWQYFAGAHGSWVNSSAGNSGDITG